MVETRSRPPSPLENWGRFRERFDGRRPAIFLDFDGTLSPLVDRPEDATLPEETRRAVERLAGRMPVSVVSGRGLDDVATRVDLPGLYYAGSHGYEIRGPADRDPPLRHSVGDDLRPLVEAATRRLEEDLQTLQGAQVEPKGHTVAVHDRRVAESERPRVERAVDRVIAEEPRLEKHGGKHVYEIRPALDWHKGRAVAWLLEHLELEPPEALPVYVGDDVTDEDAFDAVRDRDGVAVVVLDDAPRPTRADWSLRGPDEVRVLLQRLSEELS